MNIDLSERTAYCGYCGTKLFVDDEVRHICYDNAEDAGYHFEKGRQRAQQESAGYAYRYCPPQGSTGNAYRYGPPQGSTGNAYRYGPPQPQQVVINNYAPMRTVPPGVKKNKWTAFFLCVFFGAFGLHKFYEGKNSLGLLYLFTMGLFGIGWVIDIVSLLLKPNPYYV